MKKARFPTHAFTLDNAGGQLVADAPGIPAIVLFGKLTLQLLILRVHRRKIVAVVALVLQQALIAFLQLFVIQPCLCQCRTQQINDNFTGFFLNIHVAFSCFCDIIILSFFHTCAQLGRPSRWAQFYSSQSVRRDAVRISLMIFCVSSCL